jgi:hypothetical protein
MIKMGDLNLMEANPAAWSVAAGYTHPVTAERVALADSMAGRPPSGVALAAGKQEGRWFARVALSWGLPVVLGIGIAAWGIGSGLSGIGSVSPVVGASEHGPSAAWDQHLAVARAHAARVDPSAVLYRITAQPYGGVQGRLRADAVLDVAFDFVGSRGTFSVYTRDTKPPEVYEVSDIIPAGEIVQLGDVLPDAALAASRAEYLRIKPRLAFAASLPDGMRFARLDRDYLYAWLALDLSTAEAEPEWLVVYSGTAHDLVVWIDALTGQIVSRKIENQY